MGSILTIAQKAMEQGCLLGLITLALFLTFSMLDVCDLSTDGCFTLGATTGAVVALMGHPFLSFIVAMVAGVLSGYVNAFLQTKLKVVSMLAGIIVNTGLHTINLWVMGKANLNLNNTDTIFRYAKNGLKDTALSNYYALIVAGVIVVLFAVLLSVFLRTRLGLSIRATGNNMAMVRSSSINPSMMITIGLCIGGALTALSGCLFGQYQKTVEINMGRGRVTDTLAALIIGETIFGKMSVRVRIVGALVGTFIYRGIYAAALRFNIDAEAMNLVSAVIISVAIGIPAIKEYMELGKNKTTAMRKHKELYGNKEEN